MSRSPEEIRKIIAAPLDGPAFERPPFDLESAVRDASEKPSVSALYWFPRVEAAGLPVPRTEFLPFDYSSIMPIFDNEEPEEWKRLCAAIEEPAAKIGTPCFLRTDIGSAKHNGPNAYKFPDHPAARYQALWETLEDHELKHGFGGPPATAIMLREFLDLDAPFTCFKGLPIAREWRFFADAERLICHHTYWIEGALEDCFWSVNPPENWRQLLARNSQLSEAEFILLADYALTAAKTCGAFPWSVDFACDNSGKWFLIDMAPMRQSWHAEGCPNAKRKG